MAVEKRSKLILAACSGAHAVQDGLSAAVYVLLPVLAQAFGLGYAQVAAVKAVKNCAMLLFEVPSGMLSERLGESRLLVFGLACAGSGYILFVAASGLWTVLVCLTVAGMGMGFQHALSSSIVSSAFDRQGRR